MRTATSAEARMKHHEHGPHIQHFHANGVKNVAETEFALTLNKVV